MTAAETLTAHMTITEILVHLPTDAKWRIESSEHAIVTTCTGRRGLIYLDNKDPGNAGWAYQIAGTDERPEESGELNTASDVANVFAV